MASIRSGSLPLFSFLTLVSTTLGRSGQFGALQAMASRYPAFSIIAVASIYAILAKTVWERSRTATVLLSALTGVVL